MPTQIGRTAVPCASLSTTMGMFVTGSIISPRIFISTSIESSPDAACEQNMQPAQNQITCSPTRQFGLALETRTETYSPRRFSCGEVKFKMRLLEQRPDHWLGRREAPSTSTSK